MVEQLLFVTIIVRDQEEALAWYTEKLGFEKRMDFSRGPGNRWLTIGPPQQKGPEIILQLPSLEEHGPEGVERKKAQIGKGTTWVLGVRDCRAAISEMRKRGVTILEDPEEMPWGVAALIEDLYGNLFSVVQRK